MKRSFIPTLATIAAISVASCGDKAEFSVEAKIDGVGTQNLTAVWRSAPDGVLSIQEITAVGNQFNFSGKALDPVLIEVFTGQGSLLLRIMAAGGDEIRLSGTGEDLRVSGSIVGERFAEALNRIHEDADPNASIKSYIIANPGDVVSAALLVSMFDTRGNEALADSLYNAIDSAACPAWLTSDWISTLTESMAVQQMDSLREFNAFFIKPDTIAAFGGAHRYVFTQTAAQRTARVLDSLRVWAGVKDAPELLDVYLGNDRTSWRAIVEGDSAEWTQLLLPGGPAALPPLSAMNLPVSITTDSAGHIIAVCPLAETVQGR